MNFRWMVPLFVIGVAAGLAACEKLDPHAADFVRRQGGVSPTLAASERQAVSASASGADAGIPRSDRYEPAVTLTTIRTNESNVKFADGDSYADNAWTRAYANELGIRVETLWNDDLAPYNRKLDLLIASGDIPDFFRVNGAQLRQLIDNGLIADLTGLYAINVSEPVRKLLEENGGDPFRSATVDGRLMAVPMTGMLTENAPMLHVRLDWLNRLGLPEPVTLEDVLRISRAFTERDPDGNGINDTFGLAADQSFSLVDGFFNGFHAYPNIWLELGGQLVYGSVRPEMKRALGSLRELYAAGQIDPNFGTKDQNRVYESIAAGQIGLLYGAPFVGSYPLQQAKQRDPTMEWKAYPLPSVDERRALPQVYAGNNYWVVNKETKHPEAIFRLLDFWVRTFYDNTSDELYYKFNQSPENNPVWKTNVIAVTKEYKNVEESLRVIEAMETNDRSKLTPEDRGVLRRIESYRKDGTVEGWMWDYMFSKGGTLSVSDYYRKNGLYVRDRFASVALPAVQGSSAELDRLKSETFMKIVLGLLSVDEFDRFAERWRSLGGDSLANEVNAWYGNAK